MGYDSYAVLVYGVKTDSHYEITKSGCYCNATGSNFCPNCGAKKSVTTSISTEQWLNNKGVTKYFVITDYEEGNAYVGKILGRAKSTEPQLIKTSSEQAISKEELMQQEKLWVAPTLMRKD